MAIDKKSRSAEGQKIKKSNRKKVPKPSTRLWFEVFSLWFMNEIVFIVLPIVIILLIDIAFSNHIQTVMLLPEWSFAAIILYGVAISTTIELKSKYHSDFSPRMFTGTKALTILLIGAVITLTLAVLRENTVEMSQGVIQWAQAILFVHALFSVFLVVFARQEHLWLPERYPQRFTDQELMQYVVHLTKEADSTLGRLRFALETTGFNSSKIHPRDEAYFAFFIEEIEKSIGQIKTSWNTTSGKPTDSMRPDRPQLPPIQEARREMAS